MFAPPFPSAGATAETLRFVGRVHRLRLLGLGLGAVAVGAVLYENGASLPVWALLAFDGFIWPHLAYLIASRSAVPVLAEERNLVVDSAMGGLWVVLMQFSLVPSVILMTMLSMDKISVGGWRLLARASAAAVLAGAATLAVCLLLQGGWTPKPEASMPSLVAALPLLVAYPLLISAATHGLARRERMHRRELERLTAIDPATGLLNRPNWEHAVVRELTRMQRHGVPAVLMMIDIDHFKDINDGYGHPAGDEVIRLMARAILTCVREGDVACRYGGDEFGVLLANSGGKAALATAERLRARVAAATFSASPGLRCSVSVGIGGATRDLADARSWIERADAALYRAKTAGRNRIWLDEGPSAEPVLSSLQNHG